MTADEAGDVYSWQQIRQEAIRALGSVDETRRLTDPGERAPEPAVAQTQDPPRVQRHSRRARYEGLPLHSARPAVADMPVIVPPMPPRPHGMFYAPGWPAGHSQQYMWPPQQGFPQSQYPPWSSVPPMGQQSYSGPPMTQQGYSVPPMGHHGYPVSPMGQQGYFVPHGVQQGYSGPYGVQQGYSVPYGDQQAFPPQFYPGEGSSQQAFAGLDTFMEDYRPQYSEPVMVTPSSFLTSFMQESHSMSPMGVGGDRDDDQDEDEDEDDDDGDDDGDDPSDDHDNGDATRTPVVRRNPDRGAREKCPLSSYEHTQRRCREYHARPRDGRQ